MYKDSLLTQLNIELLQTEVEKQKVESEEKKQKESLSTKDKMVNEAEIKQQRIIEIGGLIWPDL